MAIVVCGYRGGLEFDIVHDGEKEMINRIGLWVVRNVRNVILVEDKGVRQVGPRDDGVFPVGSGGGDVVDFRCSEVGEARTGSVCATREEDDVAILIMRKRYTMVHDVDFLK